METVKGRTSFGFQYAKIFIIFLLFLLFSATYLSATTSYLWVRSISTNQSAPTAVAVDTDENVYVVESSTDKLLIYGMGGEYIRKLTGLNRPVSVAVDEGGRIFIGNAGSGNVEVYGPDLKLLFKLGAGDGEFLLPAGIAIDNAGVIYVADSKDNRIKIYSPEGSYKGTLGQEGAFHLPTSITINKVSGELIISDLPVVQTHDGPGEGARIQIFDVSEVARKSFGNLGQAARRSFGDLGQGEGKLTKPMGTAVDSLGKIYVTDSYQNVVQVFDSYGKSLGAVYDLKNPFRTPMGIAISSRDIAYIASLNAGKVEVYYLSNKRAVPGPSGDKK